MRELVYYVAVSLDGRIAAPDGTFDAFAQSGDHIDMILREWTDTIPAVGLEMLGLTADRSRFDTVLMGWNTYAAGLHVTADPYPHLEQYVFSRSREAGAVPAGVTLTGCDPVDLVRELKRRPGAGIWLCGGGRLATALAGEIDRLVLKVNPVVLGAGRPLFDDADGYRPRDLHLESSVPYGSGVVVNTYVPAA
ncbi:dihydrofolate reductase family protein [Pseudonocardia spirodelae]|uniref:Dihydrofolate reductase family protein n=1 Tax=Pseudonocardia spirodelae TaxID=3133431 RepID=A0ABU8T4D2_9PSEU